MADKTLWVRGTRLDQRVALWERNEAHPDGEAYVVHDGTDVEVGDTFGVRDKMKQGELVQVEPSAADQERTAARRSKRTEPTPPTPPAGT